MIKEAYLGRNPLAFEPEQTQQLSNGHYRKSLKLDADNWHLLKTVFVDKQR